MQFQQPVLRQELRQKLTQQMIQSIALLPLTITELKQKIEEELEANPALEILSEKPSVSFENLEKTAPPEAQYFENSSDTGFSFKQQRSLDDDSRRMFLEGALSRPESLQDHLLWQLRLQKIPQELFDRGEKIIYNLNSDGFHLVPPESLFQPPLSAKDLQEALDLVRTLDPIGCAVTDFHQALKVQMELLEDFPYEAQTLVREHFELLEKKKYAEIAKAMKIDEAAVLDLLEDVRRLSPFPGRAVGSESPMYAIPDALIKEKEGILTLVLNEEEIPILGIEGFFKEQSESEEGDKEAKAFVKQQVSEAQRFIQNLRYRKNTLFKVCRAIMEFQTEFFRGGPRYLKPLTLKDVAAQLELGESTVSRITTGKYVQTEWGLFELKYFFTNSISGSGSGGSQHSKEGVKHIIKEILEEASSQDRKLSDQKIAQLLEQRGIPIARRTVAKYRTELQASQH